MTLSDRQGAGMCVCGEDVTNMLRCWWIRVRRVKG